MSTFVHLHNRSDYSLLRSLTSVESLVDRAARLGMPAVALTDENVLSGALHFYNRCAGTLSASGEPIKPIIGCDLGMDTSWLGSRQPAANRDGGGRIVLIALNGDGIAQLIQLSSQTCRNGRDRPIPLTRNVLEKHADNLLLLTGGINGVPGRCVGSGMPAAAHTFLEWAKTVYGTDHVFVELVRDGKSRRDLAGDGLVELARTHALSTVATNDTFYPMTEDARAHEVLECVRESKSYEDPEHPRLPSDELSIKSAEQMFELFSDVPEAVENTVSIAAMIDPDWKLPGPIFPRPELPDVYADSGDYLRDLVRSGLQERYGAVSPEVRERAEMELQYIISTGWADAFFMYHEVVTFARTHEILVGPGRGAAPGSIVAYALGITGVDPIRHGLLFERFLNRESPTVPDIDLDIEFDRRAEVAEYLKRTYGPDRAARIVTYGTLKARNAVRRVAAVTGTSYDEAERVVGLIPRDLRITLPRAREKNPELDRLSRQDEKHRLLFEVAERLEGRLYCESTHAAGIAVAAVPIRRRVPVFGQPGKSLPVTQYASDYLEQAGVVRVDLLGLRDLTTIGHADEMIRQTDPAFVLSKIPMNDSATFDLLCEARSLGVFQFESSGMRELLAQVKPRTLADLCALNALYRPGNLNLVGPFLQAREGRLTTPERLRSHELCLRETHGVLLYQEQLMQIVADVTGFSLATADAVRRALRRGGTSEIERWKLDFTLAAGRHGYTDGEAASVFDLLRSASPRLTLKAHVAAYTTIAYQMAYLKANHAPEFFAALLKSHADNPDRLAEYTAEAKRTGVAVRSA